MEEFAFRIFKFTDTDVDGDTCAEQRKCAPIYYLFRVMPEDPTLRFGDALAVFDTLYEEETDPVKYFEKMLTEALHSINLPIIGEDK